jgi:regulatory protein
MRDLTAAELDQKCLDAALRFLAARPRSEQEVRRRLAEKGWTGERVDRVVARLGELQLVDDRAFAEFWLENRTMHRPRGARALRSELSLKGVARDVVDEAIDPARDESDDAYRAARKRAATLSTLDERAFRQRLGQFLARRGFGWETVEPVVERLWQELI